MTSWDLRRSGAFARGIWLDMLALMWTAPRRGYLETFSGQITPVELARICGEPEADVEQALSKLKAEGVYSTDASGTIYNRRYVRDEQQRQNKSKAALDGWDKSRSEADLGSPTPTPSSSPTPILNDIAQERFDRFWTKYPKKRSKGAARKAWKKLAPSEDLLNAILVAIEKQRVSVDWRKEHGQFIPYPATWLNAERWDDELPEVKSKDPWQPPEIRDDGRGIPF